MKNELDSKAALRACGIRTTDPKLATDAQHALRLAKALGGPSVMKVVSPDIVHKAAAGGVRLDVALEDVETAYSAIVTACRSAHPTARIEGVLIEERVPGGLEVFIGARVDPEYGAVVLLGKGGTDVERMAPPAAALAPLTPASASRLIDAAQGRISPEPLDVEQVAALTDCLMRVAGPQGLIVRGDVGELDINPIILSRAGAVAVDAVVMPLATEAAGRVLDQAQSETLLQARRARLGDMGALFDPQSIAFIGASTVTSKLGYRAIRNLLDFGFKGPIYPIHPTAASICDVKAYASILQVPAPVDRAYIAVGAAQVPQALKDCAAKGVKVVQVLSAGFSEWSVDESSTRLEAQMRDALSGSSMRMVGPNCIGTFSATSRVAMGAAAYCPTATRGVTFISQSGTFSGDVIRRAQVQGVPVARVLSCGNCADLDLVDYLLFCEADPATTLIAFYIESMRDPGLFFRLAAQTTKPIAILKGGTTQQGIVAAGSHTAALATNEALWRAGLEHAHVLQVDNVDELMDAFLVHSAHGMLTGDRLGIFGSGGGVSVTCSDAAARLGMKVPPLSTATAQGLKRFGVPGTSVANPIDIPVWGLKEGNRHIFGDIIDMLKCDPAIDSIVVYVEMGSIMDFADSEAEGVAEIDSICESIAQASATGPKVSVALRSTGDRTQDDLVRRKRVELGPRGIAVFASTARAVAAHHKLLVLSGKMTQAGGTKRSA